MRRKYSTKRNRYSRKRVRYTKKNTTRKYQKGGMQSLKKGYNTIRKTLTRKTLEDKIQENIDTLLSFDKPDKEKKPRIANYILTKKKDKEIIYYYPFVIQIYVILTNISKLKDQFKKKNL